ncbi:MAG: cation-translocating P-type ATPase [Candidatus Auribacterota bacterium]|jgi:Cd2+/Zn2+-exporting ATPase|nr:cation-translocating P-type ATPase [Candidatus Auribacterota bacterium]
MRVTSAAISTELQQKLVAVRLLATFLGGTLILNAYLAQTVLRISPQVASLSAFIGAILLGTPIIAKSVRSLLKGTIHMEELVSIAIIGCFALEDYKTAGAVAFIMLGAELIQSRTALGARAAIEGLIRLTPTRARKKIEDGSIEEIPAHSLTLDDTIVILPGDTVPADGTILNGMATINEASITGESMPAEKKTGDTVFAGTVNHTGKIEVKVTRAGEDTTLGKVKKLIIEAEHTKMPIMSIIDQYVTWYVPLILMIAGIILYFTRDMSRAITALVVTCPCALILATPTAIVAALSCAARLGILIKNVRHLEIASHLNALVFDKTGTLTTGELSVTKLSPVTASEDAAFDLLTAAASVAQNSRHPVSKAVVNMAKEASVPLYTADDVQEKAGMGISATINGKTILLGKREWLIENNISIKGDSKDMEGLSVLYVALNKTYAGWIGLEDKTRAEAKQATEELHRAGVKKIIMLTGDRESVAQKVATELGCQEYRAHCLPEEKLEVVNELKQLGYSVGVVGDGINDAPALAAGNIGIAMGAAGSDIAIHSASISLMNNDLLRLPFIIKISRKTRAVIYQNLAFGALFILTGLLASGFGYLNPILAALLHNIGSFVVIFNSARLVRFGEDLVPFESTNTEQTEAMTEYVTT